MSVRELPPQLRLAIVGRGRLGHALYAALQRGGYIINAPLGRGAAADDADAVLLCVPDSEIASAAAVIAPGRLVGHCSGASTLLPLAPHEAFSLHPLMTITEHGASFPGSAAAVAGSSARALRFAKELATALGMEPLEIADQDRAAYHAAASIASNFLITLESAAEQLAAAVGVERRFLAPLVRASLENWAQMGGRRALTGPVVRGDEETVRAQRAAVAERAPDLVPLFDALLEATRTLARSKP